MFIFCPILSFAALEVDMPARSPARKSRKPMVAALIAAPAFLFTACGGRAERPAVGTPAPPPAPTVAIEPHMTAQGALVEVEATGFTPSSTVEIGIGPPASEYEVIRTVQTDAKGRVMMTLQVPQWAERDRPYVVVVADTDDQPRAVSDALVLEGDAVVLRVDGRFTDEGVECRALRSDNGTLYTLGGTDLSAYRTGDRVTITGTVPDASICMQGVTLAVREITRR